MVQSELSPEMSLGWLMRMHGAARHFFENGLRPIVGVVQQALDDGLDHLVPVLAATRSTVPALRREVGKAVWRRIHHGSLDVNILRALTYDRHRGTATWAEIVAIPDHHLRSCRNAIDWPTARFAAMNAPDGQFQTYAMLYRDVVKLGLSPKPSWTVKRMKRERDALFRQARIAEADPTPWAAPCAEDHGALRFTRLTSDRAIVVEAVAMRHCVATYLESARAGQISVWRCEGAERATLMFGATGGMELRAFANGEVSAVCHAAALNVRQRFLLSQGPDALS